MKEVFSNKLVLVIIAPLGWTDLSTLPKKKGRVESKELTVGRPAGVAVGAVSGVCRGDRGHAGAPDEAEGCQATRCDPAGEARGTQARLAGGFGKQRAGRCHLGLGGCCCLWSRSSVVGEDLICWKRI